MKYLFTLTLFLLNFTLNAQDLAQMSSDDIAEKLNKYVRTDYGINFSIFRAYEYSDNQGIHYLVFTENAYSEDSKGNPKNDSIAFFSLNKSMDGIFVEWDLKDHIKENEFSEEDNIWFFTKYFSANDLDGDGTADPIVVYGSTGINGKDDGRLYIALNYKWETHIIEHQNGVLDDQRNTEVPAAFYELPKTVQQAVVETMERIENDGNAIFPAGWKAGMESRKLHLDEN